MPKRPRSANELTVVVVESHHHVLEHIHAYLRRSFYKKWTLWHWDAHADLAVPSDINAKACFRPHDYQLYETLDLRTSGMAEWILPLVLGAGLTHICWVQPPSSTLGWQQRSFAPGTYNILVGVIDPSGKDPASFVDLTDDARMRVQSSHPYYLDDLDEPSTIIDTKKKLHLTQTLYFEVTQALAPAVASPTTTPWLLDVCLDYFGADNPFLIELEEINPSVVKLLQKVAVLQPVRDDFGQKSAHMYQDHLRAWRSAMRRLATFNERNETSTFDAASDDENMVLNVRMHSSRSENVDGVRALGRLRVTLRFSTPQVRQLVIEAIPHLSMPHREVSVSVDDFAVGTRDILSSSSRPFLVTVARSSTEGFTPKVQVEDLQNNVLHHLHGVYCGCRDRSRWTPEGNGESCRLRLVFDYGAWEGSSAL